MAGSREAEIWHRSLLIRTPSSLWKLARIRKPRSRNQPSARRLRCEQLETRNLLNAAGWYNDDAPADVNNDGTVTPVDALLVANVIYANDGDSVTLVGENSENVYLDVDNDGQIGESDFAAVVDDAGGGAAAVTTPLLPALPRNTERWLWRPDVGRAICVWRD